LIVAAFLGGSYARDAATESSDVDVYVIAREQDYPTLWARRRTLLEEWGEVAYAEDRPNFEGLGFDMVLFELAEGVDGEIAFAHTGNFLVMHGGPYRVLVDRIGLLEGVEFPLL
jgi:predicted nucleotidyltransferase